MWNFFKNKGSNTGTRTSTSEKNPFNSYTRKDYSVTGRIKSISENLIIPDYIKTLVEEELSSKDPLSRFNVENLWTEFCDKLDNRDWFDVCGLSNIVNKYGIKHTKSSKEVYEKLRSLHCTDWVKIPDELYNMMPDYINYVLSSGTTHLRGYNSNADVDIDAREVRETLAIGHNAS